MKLSVLMRIGPQSRLVNVEVEPDHTIRKIKQQVCSSFGVDPFMFSLIYRDTLLSNDATVGKYGMPDNSRLILMPYNIPVQQYIQYTRASDVRPTRQKTRLDRYGIPILFSREDIVTIVIATALAILSMKLFMATSIVINDWDGYCYLLNARRFLYGYDPYSLFDLLRPPVIPVTISAVWAIIGESYLASTAIQPIFTVAAALILFVLVKEMFNVNIALLSMTLVLVIPTFFIWTNIIMVHGETMFFMVLSALAAWKAGGEDRSQTRSFIYCALAGITLALATLSRYTTLLFAVPVFILLVQLPRGREQRWIAIDPFSRIVLVIVFSLLTWAPWLYWNYAYAGGDPFASLHSAFYDVTSVSYVRRDPWYLYFIELPTILTIPGAFFLVAGIADRQIVFDRRRLFFSSWFLLFLLAYSSLIAVKSSRFTLDWAPALAVLMALGAQRLLHIANRLHAPKKPIKIAYILLLILWLGTLTNSSVSAGLQDVASRNEQTFQKDFFIVVNWIKSNMAKNERGASEHAPQFTYYSHRYFYNVNYLEDEANRQGSSLSTLLAQFNVKFNMKYYVVTKSYGWAKLSKVASLKKVISLEILEIYKFEPPSTL